MAGRKWPINPQGNYRPFSTISSQVFEMGSPIFLWLCFITVGLLVIIASIVHRVDKMADSWFYPEWFKTFAAQNFSKATLYWLLLKKWSLRKWFRINQIAFPMLFLPSQAPVWHQDHLNARLTRFYWSFVDRPSASPLLMNHIDFILAFSCQFK